MSCLWNLGLGLLLQVASEERGDRMAAYPRIAWASVGYQAAWQLPGFALTFQGFLLAAGVGSGRVLALVITVKLPAPKCWMVHVLVLQRSLWRRRELVCILLSIPKSFYLGLMDPLPYLFLGF